MPWGNPTTTISRIGTEAAAAAAAIAAVAAAANPATNARLMRPWRFSRRLTEELWSRLCHHFRDDNTLASGYVNYMILVTVFTSTKQGE